MKSEYQKYLERRSAIENTFDKSATQALLEYVKSLPLNLRAHILNTVAQSFYIDKVVARIGDCEYEGFLADKDVFWYAVSAQQWSQELIDIFIRFFSSAREGSYIDFGANIGLTTIPICKSGARRCFAVEAAPENFQLLQRNLLRNRIDNCSSFNVAIFNGNTSINLELSERNFGDHRIRMLEDSSPNHIKLYDENSRKTVTVRTARCDDLLKNSEFTHPLGIKSDMQGAEVFLFSDGGATLSQCDMLISEYWPYGITRLGYTPEYLHGQFKTNFSYGHVVSYGRNSNENTWHPGTRLLPIDAFIELLQNQFASINDKTASAAERTRHANIILAKLPIPV